MPSAELLIRKIPWRRKWQPTPVLLPVKSLGQRSLLGYSPWGHKESDSTEHSTASSVNSDSWFLISLGLLEKRRGAILLIQKPNSAS